MYHLVARLEDAKKCIGVLGSSRLPEVVQVSLRHISSSTVSHLPPFKPYQTTSTDLFILDRLFNLYHYYYSTSMDYYYIVVLLVFSLVYDVYS
jgi:hypothetical protein